MSLKSLLKKAGGAIGKAKNVLLPLAGVAAGLALPGIGGAVGKLLTKGSDAIGKVKKQGVLGIGDGKPGVFGIGTGKGILAALEGKKGADGKDGVDAQPMTYDAAGNPTPAESSMPVWAWPAAAGLAYLVFKK